MAKPIQNPKNDFKLYSFYQKIIALLHYSSNYSVKFSAIPCNITLTDSELIFSDCTGTRSTMKHPLKSEVYLDLLQRKVDVVIVRPSHHRSEMTIGCPFKPAIRIWIITEAHDQLAYAFMIRDKIRDTICNANSKQTFTGINNLLGYSLESVPFSLHPKSVN